MSVFGEIEVDAQHQHVLAKVVDWKGGSFELHSPNQTIGRRDKAIVVEVVSAGPGNVSRGTRNPCTLIPGDLAVVNLYHRSHEIVVFAGNLSTFNWEQIMALVRVDEKSKSVQLSPLQGYVITKTNERRAQYFMMGKSQIINPNGDAQLTGGASFNTAGKRVEQLKIACEEVVSVGPGAVVDGLWQEPSCKPGEMVLYDTSITPVSFMAGGQSFTLVHMRSIVLTMREAPNDGRAPEESADPS